MLLSRWAHHVSYSGASALAKTVARASLGLVVLIVVAQYFFVGRYDPNRCVSLLNSGSWPPSRDPPGGERHEFDKWEPTGCLMHEYPWDEFRGCLGSDSKRVVFVGDSTVRQIFWAAAQRLDSVRAEEERMAQFVSENPQHDVSLNLDGIELVFVWDPWLNSTGLAEELARFSPDPAAGQSVERRTAALLVLGAPGLWAARNGGDDYFELFKRGVDYVRPYLKHDLYPEAGSEKQWPDLQNQIVMTPVQVPRYRKLSPARAEALTPSKIRRMNDYLAHLPQSERVHVVGAYNEMTVRVRRAFEDTGLHVREVVADRKLDLLLNLRCNAGLAQHGGGHAARTTCCTAYAQPVRGQRAILVTGTAVLPMLLWARRVSLRRLGRRLPHARHLRAALTFFAVLLYCYLADRTHLFAKAEKRLSAISVTSLMVITSVASFLSVRKSGGGGVGGGKGMGKISSGGGSSVVSTGTTACGADDDSSRFDPGFLPREVSDEWKGLMQFLLLVFHFQDTTGLLWTYKLSRLFAAAYLFLSTYGHATYFLRTEDYSLRRVAAVVWRLNFLPFVLSLMMQTDGTLYSFPRLVTFWFFVTYVAMRAGGRHLNTNPTAVMLKLVLMAALTNALANHAAWFEAVGWALSFFGPVAYNAEDVRHPIAGDLFMPFLGMIAAVLAHRVSALKSDSRRLMATTTTTPSTAAAAAASAAFEASPGFPRSIASARPGARPATTTAPRLSATNLGDKLLLAILYPDRFSESIYPIILLCAIVGLLVFFFETQSLHRYVDRDSYDAYHPYISLVPVPAFALLRNCHPALRAHHLALPALLGPLALEAYVLRNHAWLAGDGLALLRPGLWPRRDDGGRWEPVSPTAALAASPSPSLIALAGWRLETMLVSVVFLFLCWHARRASARLAEWALGCSRGGGGYGGGGGGSRGHHARLPSFSTRYDKRSDNSDDDNDDDEGPESGTSSTESAAAIGAFGGGWTSRRGQWHRRHPSSASGRGEPRGRRWWWQDLARVAVVLGLVWLSNACYNK